MIFVVVIVVVIVYFANKLLIGMRFSFFPSIFDLFILFISQDVISLFGTPRHELLGFWTNATTQNQQPQQRNEKRGKLTAIKAEWFEYHFTNWEKWRESGEWWERERIKSNPPLFYVREEEGEGREREKGGYESFVGRWVVLFVGCLGMFVGVVVGVDVGFVGWRKKNMMNFFVFLCSFLFFFGSFYGALLWDYPSLFSSLPSPFSSLFPPHNYREEERGIGERGIGYGCCCFLFFLFLLKVWGVEGWGLGVVGGGGAVVWLWCMQDFGY